MYVDRRTAKEMVANARTFEKKNREEVKIFLVLHRDDAYFAAYKREEYTLLSIVHLSIRKQMGSSDTAALLDYVLRKSRPGDIQSVINTIDYFAWNKKWLMNIGDIKGKILDDAVRERNPATILEIGNLFFGSNHDPIP